MKEPITDEKKFTKLVLSGGSIRGYAYIGFLRYLEEYGIVNNITSIVSTSVGSMFALFMFIGYSSHELESIFMDYTFELDEIKMMNLFEKFGLDNGEKFEKIIKVFLKNKNFNENITLQQLYEKTGKNLVCTACSLNTKKSIFFDRIMYPDIPCYKAIRASTSLPVLFTPAEYKNELFIDGGLSENIPVKYFLNSDKGDLTEKELSEILCVSLTSTTKTNEFVKINSFSDYISSVIQIVLSSPRENHHKLIKLKSISFLEIIFNDKFSNDFKLSNDLKKKLIDTGYTKTKKHFKDFLVIKKVT